MEQFVGAKPIDKIRLLIWPDLTCHSVVLLLPGHIVQAVERLTQEPEVPGLIPGPATYFCFSFP